jgi:hypothetical protein
VFVAQVTLDGNAAALDPSNQNYDPTEAQTFADNFASDMAVTLGGIDPSQIKILSVTSGSVIVDFELQVPQSEPMSSVQETFSSSVSAGISIGGYEAASTTSGDCSALGVYTLEISVTATQVAVKAVAEVPAWNLQPPTCGVTAKHYMDNLPLYLSIGAAGGNATSPAKFGSVEVEEHPATELNGDHPALVDDCTWGVGQ